jgi:hypothetical protein
MGELGVGRGQIGLLAALFHADAPNDVAPSAYKRRRFAAPPLSAALGRRPKRWWTTPPCRIVHPVTELLHNLSCAVLARPVQRATSWWACF